MVLRSRDSDALACARGTADASSPQSSELPIKLDGTALLDRLARDGLRRYRHKLARRSIDAPRSQRLLGAVSDDGNAWVLRAELPGLSEKDVELTVNAESVTLRAERKVEQLAKHTVHRRERPSYRVARTFTLGTKIDPERVEATMKNGVLTVKLAKAADAQPRKVLVRAS